MDHDVFKAQGNSKLRNKVLMILHLPPPINGAGMVGKYIKDSFRINNNFDIDYINLSTSTSLSEYSEGGLKKIFRFLQIKGKVSKALLFKRYQLCYVTLNASGTAFIKDLMIVAILKLSNRNIIYHFHNKGISTGKKTWIKDILYNFAFRNTKSILLSPNLYADFKRYLDKRDVYFCANGIPVLEHSLNCKEDHRNAGVKCRLLFVSNLILEKGVLVLLEACKLLKEKQYDFECHFVGAWFDFSKADFDDFVRNNGLTENVFEHGPKYNMEKVWFFEHSDIFVFPSFYRNESFPLVLLEAMSYGLPVVTTSEGGIPDIVIDRETGYITERKNSYDLAAKLEMLISNPGLCQKFGEAGRKRFLSCFTLDKFEDNFIKILDANLAN